MRNAGGLQNLLRSIDYVKRLSGFGSVLSSAIRGMLVAGAVAILLALVDHLLLLGSPLVLLVLILPGAAVGAVVGYSERPSSVRAARFLDTRFALADRATTALELKDSAAPIAQLQREDAAERVRGLRLASSTRRSFQAREALGVPLVLAIFLALALTVPAAAHSRTPSGSGDSARIQKVLHHQLPPAIKKARQLAAQHPHNPVLGKIYQQLRYLQLQLKTAHTRSQALKQLSQTQLALHKLVSALHPVSKLSASQMLRQLHSVTHISPRTGTGTQSQRQAAKALNKIASKLSHMTSAQRAALAQKLARAANSVSNPKLQSGLRQAASSLGYKDPQGAASALRQTASSLAQSPGQQSAMNQVASTSSKLQGFKGAVTGLSPSRPGGHSGTQGQSGQSGHSGHGQGQGNGHGSGHGSGHGQGQGNGQGTGHGQGQGQGSGHGQGNGHGQGQGQGSGNGQGSSGGHGPGGGTGTRGGSQNGGAGARVYIPGRTGKGPHTVLKGPNGAPLPGVSVPYQEVILRYEQSARSALDHGSLPPSLQSYVRQYFTSISR
jgi:hypothetical protein